VPTLETPAQPQTPAPVQSQIKTNPYLGILGVFLGAAVATLNARLVSVGLPDLRGALGLGFDEASWIPTALNMATMFSGVFVVFLGAVFGPRRILLQCAAVFTVASVLLPFAPGYWGILAMSIVAGISSGTFYSLTMTFVLTALPKRLIIFGIAAYAADIVFVSNIASLLEGWYIDHLSWRWIFWTAAVVTPVMMACIYHGIPRRPLSPSRPSWRGFAYFSVGLALLYGALDQGERLYWLNSGVIIAMLAGGIFLVGASGVRRLLQPNPILKLSFLKRRNIIILALSVFVFKFVHLSTVVLIPGFLGNIQEYRPLETGHALAWVAIPMFIVVWLVAMVVLYTTSRLTLALGLTVAAVGCWICAHLDTVWAGNSFEVIELLLTVGIGCTYVGLVAALVIEGLEAGALTSVAGAATYSGFIHFIRIFGGETGVTVMTHFISVREKFHSNLLGLHVQAGSWITVARLRELTEGMLSASTGRGEAQYRAIDILSKQVQAQAYTMAIADGFILVCWMVVAYLVLMMFLRPAKVTFQDLRKMQ
jgi:MFS transporter, DHA2 family, multidrug resistance protein